MDEADGAMLPDDEALLDALARMGADDAPPDDVVAAAKAMWTWRSIDAELAALTYDSLDADANLVGVRGDPGVRQLAFESGELSVRLEITPGPPGRLLGQLVPPTEAEVTLRRATVSGTGSVTVSVTVPTDAHGRFQVAGLEPGPFSLRCVPVDQPALVVDTAWVVL